MRRKIKTLTFHLGIHLIRNLLDIKIHLMLNFLHTIILNLFEKIGGYLTIRPGYKVGDLKVTNSSCFRHNSVGSLDYKLNHAR